MSTFSQIKTNIATLLDDISNISYSTTELNQAVQDAYDETVCLSQCIINKTTLNFQNNLNYYNFHDQTYFPNTYVADYIQTTAIFSNLTNLWLLDDKVIKDFDRERLDWELWTGNAVWWCPVGSKRVAIVPKALVASGTFDLYYWASAPTVVDGNSPLVPPDFERLIEMYATGLLLEGYEEFTKASNYFNEFFGIDADGEQNWDKGIWSLLERSKNIAKSDLLMYA